MTWGLPVSVEIGGVEFAIRTDFRAILDICAVVNEPDLNGEDKALAVLSIFYPDAESLPPERLREAVERCFWFIDGGREWDNAARKSPRLVDWEQDFQYIAAPVNRVVGREIRAVEYMHWWTFLAAYMEIGECTFAQVVRVRDRLARGKPLDKQDREWYRQNWQLVDFRRKYSDADNEFFNGWGGG